MNADGSTPVNLTNNPAGDQFPAWSPNGKRIAFARGSGFGRELYVMDADGTNQTRLTFNSLADVQPVWSANGKEIAFVRFGPDQNRDIYVMDAEPNGSTQQVTNDPALLDLLPDWSPARRIAFTSDRGGSFGVYAVRAGGSGLRRLTSPELEAGTAGWSPDGEAIVFADNFCATCPESDIVVLQLETGELTRLTGTADNELNPDWSPGGELIAYDRGEIDVPVPGVFSPTDIYVIGAEGGQPVNLTSSPNSFDINPDWEPVADD